MKHKIFPLESKYTPKKQREGDALYDLYARLGVWENGEPKMLEIFASETEVIPLGFKVICVSGYEFQVRPRSGLAKDGIQIGNSPGCVDENYRGEVGAIVYNSTKDSFWVKDGDRICQGSFNKLSFDLFDEINEEEFNQYTTKRGEKGFGSSGV